MPYEGLGSLGDTYYAAARTTPAGAYQAPKLHQLVLKKLLLQRDLFLLSAERFSVLKSLNSR